MPGVKFSPTPMISDAHRSRGTCLEVGRHVLKKSDDGRRVADGCNRGSGEGVGFSLCAAPLYEPSPRILEIERSRYGHAIEAVQYQNDGTNIQGTVKFQGTEMSENFSQGMSTEDGGKGWDKEKAKSLNRKRPCTVPGPAHQPKRKVTPKPKGEHHLTMRYQSRGTANRDRQGLTENGVGMHCMGARADGWVWSGAERGWWYRTEARA
ncbi:hypothetical protein F5141DRAFT_1060601 [Pisolithus sp. B1]|nr:hypothetical protein F5141DRAFT_1060601 [Pisolithus sp. B1]